MFLRSYAAVLIGGTNNLVLFEAYHFKEEKPLAEILIFWLLERMESRSQTSYRPWSKGKRRKLTLKLTFLSSLEDTLLTDHLAMPKPGTYGNETYMGICRNGGLYRRIDIKVTFLSPSD